MISRQAYTAMEPIADRPGLIPADEPTGQGNSGMTFSEADMYRPVKELIEKAGYTVRGEAAHCDLCAEKDGAVLVVEMKKNLTLALLTQGVKRQKVSDMVYLAVPRPSACRSRGGNRDVVHLLRRLELGLIHVTMTGTPRAEVIVDAVPFDRKKSAARWAGKRKALLEEIRGRSADYNTGGCTGRKIMTRYRENALEAACILSILGTASPRSLVSMGAGGKTGSILLKNHYGWFERVGRGLYRLSSGGKEAIEEYSDVSAALLEKHAGKSETD
jgi:hypothetical protein